MGAIFGLLSAKSTTKTEAQRVDEIWPNQRHLNGAPPLERAAVAQLVLVLVVHVVYACWPLLRRLSPDSTSASTSAERLFLSKHLACRMHADFLL